MRDVAVVVPNRNYGAYICAALDSLYEQTHPPAEVAIVDDGSTDGSVEAVQRWLAARGRPAGWTLLGRPAQGLQATLTAGLQATKSPLVMRLDADDLLITTCLERLVTALADNPDASYAYPAMQLFEDASGRYPVSAFDPARLVLAGNYVTACALVRREALLELPERKPLPAWEDWDQWLALLAKGHVGVFVDEDLYLWRRHGSTRNQLTLTQRRLLRLRIWGRHPGLVLRYTVRGLPHLLRRVISPVKQQ